ncbi:hypothetical protein [Curtobacterium sp. MCPF17_052]|uniref:hypothetical protein n=1 Tax=Curtobacterium sp. MCPF17_052 TaxID=2175655 RepID=UPI0024DF7959|nr:hypothetical protein [Curtobacterium sp. MCPF17_052]WIB14060.1 hypothetical protein DEJ36_10610 [Curtobacterium sp. MCPF17_052]
MHKSIQLHGLPPRVTALIESSRSGLSFEEFDQVRAGATSDAQAREERFGRSRDTADLGVERNVLRHRPQSVVVRQSEGVSTGGPHPDPRRRHRCPGARPAEHRSRAPRAAHAAARERSVPARRRRPPGGDRRRVPRARGVRGAPPRAVVGRGR